MTSNSPSGETKQRTHFSFSCKEGQHLPTELIWGIEMELISLKDEKTNPESCSGTSVDGSEILLTSWAW